MKISKRMMYLAAAVVLLLLIVLIVFSLSRSGRQLAEEPESTEQVTSVPTAPAPTQAPPTQTPEPTEELPVITPPAASSDNPTSGSDIVITTAPPASDTDIPETEDPTPSPAGTA